MDKDAEGKIQLDQYKGLQMFYYCWNEHKIKGRNAAGGKKKKNSKSQIAESCLYVKEFECYSKRYMKILGDFRLRSNMVK